MPWYPKGFLPCLVPPAPLSQSCVPPRPAAPPPGITCAPFRALGLLTYILVVQGERISLSHEMVQDLLTLGMCLSSFSAQKHLCMECSCHFTLMSAISKAISLHYYQYSNVVRLSPSCNACTRKEAERRTLCTRAGDGRRTSYLAASLLNSVSSFLTGNKSPEVHLKSVYF